MPPILSILQDQWTCPITHTQMLDPVLTADGYTYEKTAIENWLKISNISPKTGLNLTSTNLIPNRALKALVQKILIHLPHQVEKLSVMQNQNKHLKYSMAQMREQIQKLNQVIEAEQQISKKQRTLKKIQQKYTLANKTQSKEFKTQIQRLQQTIRNQNKDQINMKLQLRNVTENLEAKIKHIETKMKQSEEGHLSKLKKIEQFYVKIIDDNQELLSDRGNLIYLLIFIIKKLNKTFSIVTYIKEFIKPLQQQRIRRFYSIYTYFISILKLVPQEMAHYNFYPVSYFHHESGFYQKYQMVSFPLFERLYKQFAQRLFTGSSILRNIMQSLVCNSHQNFKQENWQMIVKSPFAMYIKALQLESCNLTNVTRKQLASFNQLKYLNLKSNNFTFESIDELKAFQIENPDKIVLFDGAQ